MKNLFQAKHITTVLGITAQVISVVITAGLLEGHPAVAGVLFAVGLLLEAYGYDVKGLANIKPKAKETDTKKK